MKRTLTLTETITKEVELILPCWRKTSTSYYYITENECIEVMNLEKWSYIGMSVEPSMHALNDSKAISYEEFQEAFREAVNRLSLKIDTDVRYEFQINEGSIYIDEIVNGKANRQFRLKVASGLVSDTTVLNIISEWYFERNEETHENHIMIEEYARFHRDKWEEVAE